MKVITIIALLTAPFLLASFAAAGETEPAASTATSDMRDKGQFFAQVGNETLSSLQFIAPADSRFRYEGRIDYSDPAGPMIIWQGSRISIDFEGETLAFRLDSLGQESFFDVHIDGSKAILAVQKGKELNYIYQKPLAPGRHTLTLFKRSEAAAGTVLFKGIGIASGAKAWAPAPISYKLAMEFFGDSITAGACNEDGDTDQWATHLTHNNALSYAAMTAAAFSADYRNVSVSGMGVAAGFVEVLAGEMWDKLYPSAKSASAFLKAWTPDVVLVNLGDNDYDYPNTKGKPVPPEFTDSYVSYVKAIRGAYPSAHIVLLTGGMFGGTKSVPLRKAWEAAVSRLESADPAISHFIFTHWTSNHPRVADHRAMADELIAWLKQHAFMKSRL
ncbi:MAG: GDSL-type esterase/lipase family protein [Opitutaceae bacterium]|jgi:lysophospholipase L1-like esterase